MNQDLLDYMNTSAQQQRRWENSKEGTAHNLQQVPVINLSEQQKALKLKIRKHGKSEDRTAPPKERNNMLRLVSKRLKEVPVEEAHALAAQVTSTDDCRKILCAAKQLRLTKPTPPIIFKTPMATSW